MASPKLTVKYKPSAIKATEAQIDKSLAQTADWLTGEINDAEVVPYRTGATEGSLTETKIDSRHYAISVGTKYSPYIYFANALGHRHMEFNKGHNSNAKDHWFEDWIDGGSKAKEVQEAFKKFLKRNMS